MATIADPMSMSASFRTSQSAAQASASNYTPYSEMALTQLPQVDFNFDDLRRRMAEFTTKFDAYIDRGRKRVLEERNEFKARLSEVQEESRTATTQISSLQTSLSTHQTLLARETAELSSTRTQISSLEAHAQSSRQHRDRLVSQIAQTQHAINAKLAAQQEYSEKMEKQEKQNDPELRFWETYLGCTIDGAGEDGTVRVRYVFPSSGGNGRTTDEEQEATFELRVPDSGSGGYEVLHTKPKLEGERVEKVVQRLNETRDIAVLLKGMRALFKEGMGGHSVSMR